MEKNIGLDNLFASLLNYEGNWREDFSHENGNYENTCTKCKNNFFGHKRRVICKNCYLSAMLHFYKQPFRKLDSVSWVYDANDNFVFQFVHDFDSDEFSQLEDDVINSLNSEKYLPVEKLNLSIHPDDSNFILNNDRMFIMIRGWGNLTSANSHNLPEDKACEIQDNFAQWLINKINPVRD